MAPTRNPAGHAPRNHQPGPLAATVAATLLIWAGAATVGAAGRTDIAVIGGFAGILPALIYAYRPKTTTRTEVTMIREVPRWRHQLSQLRWRLIRALVPGIAVLDAELLIVGEQLDRHETEMERINDEFGRVEDLREGTDEDLESLRRHLDDKRSRTNALACLLAVVAKPYLRQIEDAAEGTDQADLELVRAGLIAKADGLYWPTTAGAHVSEILRNATAESVPF